MTDAEIVGAFGMGRHANDIGLQLDDNPHPPGLLADAWREGWVWQEGPVYTVTARARRDYARATMADIWPEALRTIAR